LLVLLLLLHLPPHCAHPHSLAGPLIQSPLLALSSPLLLHPVTTCIPPHLIAVAGTAIVVAAVVVAAATARACTFSHSVLMQIKIPLEVLFAP
jgi:hypothetical protein